MSLLSARNLKVDIERSGQVQHVLRGIDLDLKKRASMGIVGESGSGKTMTARTILRLLPKRAMVTSGEVQFAGQNILAWPEKKVHREIRGRQIVMVPQNARESLNPLFSVARQIADVYRRHRGGGKKEAETAAIEMLDRVSMPDPRRNARAYPHELSGGMCQRVITAMALICLPTLLIADEPTTGLDMTIQAQVLELIVEVVEQTEATLLFISHDITVIAEICDHIAVMYCGQIVELADAQTILNNPVHPYTKGLISSFAIRDDKRLDFIPGAAPDLRLEPPGCAFAPRCDFSKKLCVQEIPCLKEMESGHFVACHIS